MSIKPFEYHEPADITEALTLLDQYGAKARVLAGGIDLVPRMRTGAIQIDHIVNIQNINELITTDFDSQTGLRFGAMVTLHDLETSRTLQEHYRVLYEAIHQITSVQTKCMGTAVGNLCVATSGSDVATVLMALDAELDIVGVNGPRKERLADFYTGYHRTSLGRGEMVAGVFVPAPAKGSGAAFMNLVRTHCDCAKVIVSVAVDTEGDRCVQARIGLGAVAPTVIRATAAESYLAGEKIQSSLIAKVAETAAEEASPITDLRSSEAYRRQMVKVLVSRALDKACASTGGRRK